MKKTFAKALLLMIAGGLSFMGNAFAGSFVETQPTPGGTSINVAGGDNLGKSDQLITSIKVGVNWILGLLGLIALVILLWGGFQMVTAAGSEEKYKKGFTILKQAGIGLIFIGLSALFVNLIFWIIGIIT